MMKMGRAWPEEAEYIRESVASISKMAAAGTGSVWLADGGWRIAGSKYR